MFFDAPAPIAAATFPFVTPTSPEIAEIAPLFRPVTLIVSPVRTAAPDAWASRAFDVSFRDTEAPAAKCSEFSPPSEIATMSGLCMAETSTAGASTVDPSTYAVTTLSTTFFEAEAPMPNVPLLRMPPPSFFVAIARCPESAKMEAPSNRARGRGRRRRCRRRR